MSTATSAQRLTTTDALTYLKTVKEVFRDKKEMYDYFLEVMKDFKAQRIDTSGVITRVKEIFRGRRDLILGFNTFLPKGYEIILPPEEEAFQKKKPVEFDEAISFVNKIKIRFQGDDHVYKAFLGILNMYRKDNKSIAEVYHEVSILFQDHPDLLVEFTHFLPDTSGTASICHGDYKGHSLTKSMGMHIEKKPAISYAVDDIADQEQQKHIDKAVKREDINNRAWHHSGYGNNLKSACGDDSLVDQVHQGTHETRSTFCEKVKERLQDSGYYEKFLDCVRSFQKKFLTASQFRKLIASLLGAYPDLMEESEDFITYVEKTGWLLSNRHYRSSKVDQGDGGIDREDKEKNNIDSRGRDRYHRGLTANNTDILGQRMSQYSKDRFATKPIHELDLSNCNSCTPSYRLLPENYPIPIASRRTKIGAKVLNDHWVSVTSGSEDYSFKHMRKNQYEESLFRCEDDRFELDMLLESITATAKRVEEFLDSISQMNQTENAFCIEDHLTALHLRCIERLYGDHGLDVMDVLMKNAPLALPVILTRLKQKQEEWERCRADFNKIWAEIYSKNYHRSLDRRSFYFKQHDSKCLRAKALLDEMKDISEKNESEDEPLLLFFQAGYKQPIRPHMDFRYADLDIHGDLYQLVNYASGEVCTPEQHDKVMKIWTNFLEALLGLPPCPKSVQEKLTNHSDMDVDVEAKGSEENSMSGDLPRHGDKADLTENGNNGAENESSAASKASPTESYMLCDDILNGPEFVSANCEIGALPNQEAQGSVKPMSSSVENKALSDGGREECELSPNQNPHTIALRTDGEEISGNAVEGEESVEGSLEGENALENDHLSVNDSANVEAAPNETDKVATGEGEVDHMEDETMSVSDRFFETAKPINKIIPAELRGKEQNSQIFYANDSFYLLFRLHQMLYERMHIAKLHSTSIESKWRATNITAASESDAYIRFKEALHSLLDGSSDNAKFEDECQAIIGAQSYVLFTLDRLIHKLVKQLQSIATEEVENKILQLYAYERSRSRERFVDAVYHENARFLLPDDNLYRIECLGSPMRLTIQLLKNEYESLEPVSSLIDPDFDAYLHGNYLSVNPERTRKGVFLTRNKRIYSSGDEDEDLMEAMEGVIFQNDMQIKLDSKTLRASYVLATEDFFCRPKNRRKVLHLASNGCAKRRKLAFCVE